MRLFTCETFGRTSFFENARCEHGSACLGVLPERGPRSAIEPLAVNSLNRWTGQPGFHPFVLPPPVVGRTS
ncbi:MAG: hypothetical protein KIT43_14845 [Bauldia sp.]|nr:hypothetical protein [Bauldia sp.]MCW5718190.1 hypothetical protein [Bauldia sp.]